MTTSAAPRRELLIAVICFVLIILLTGGGAVLVVSDSAFSSAFMLTTAAETMYNVYPENVDWSRVVNNGLKAVFEELDPWSGVIEPHSFHEMEEELSGGYDGLGIALFSLDEGLFVHSVTENSPADKSGLRIGDIILKADSIDFTDTSIFFSSSHLRGEDGSKSTLTVFRPATLDTFDVEIVRGRVEFSSVPYAGMIQRAADVPSAPFAQTTADSFLYIRISDFEAGVSDDVMSALDKYLPDDNAQVHGIVLDLRDNPGGLLYEAVATADLFLEEGKLIVGTQGRSFWETETFHSQDADFSFGRHIAILVDDQTASAAEILAGALKYNGRAILVGDTTFGKGLVQGHISMLDGAGLRLTVSRYYLEGGRFLNDFDSTLNEIGHGLHPDTVLSFVEYHPFIAKLEHELYFHRFASLHASELDSVRLSSDSVDSSCNLFAGFCYSRGFTYQSELSQWAELLTEAAKVDSVMTATMSTVRQIGVLAHRADSILFSDYKQYIFHRLCWLAVETLRSESKGYAEVEVPDGAAIQETAYILRDWIAQNKKAPLP
jgi:carboxyl-terminal processing protease